MLFVAREFFFYAGANVKLRGYNALLQGQFRDSNVRFGRDDLENVILETWAGVSYEFSNRLKVTSFIRGRTAEIDGINSRDPVWGGFVFSRSY